jgi:carbon storage regulator
MLVLSRKLGERILIGEGVIVTVVAVEGGRVRIGIHAAAEVQVLREELLAAPRPPRKMSRLHEGGKW